MFAYPLRTAALALFAAAGFSACTTPYGYSGVSVGVGSGYYDSYYGGYGYGAGYPGYGYGYGYPGYGFAYAPYWGWYDNFYYPGTGFYVYDSYRRPHRWTDAQRRYWTVRRERALSTSTKTKPVVIRENWNEFDRSGVKSRPERIERRIERPDRVERNRVERIERRIERPDRVERIERSQPATIERTSKPVRVERSVSRTEKSAAREQRTVAREQRKSEIRAQRSSRDAARKKDTTSEE